MKRFILFFAAFAIALGAWAQEIDPATGAETAPKEEKATPPAIEWLTWDEATRRMEKEPRKIMVDVYTDWCGWCKKMDASTMKDPTVVQIIQEQYYAVKMDGEYKGDIDFKGRTFKFVASGRRGYHELPAELMQGKMSYPTLVFLDEDYGIIQPLPGFKQARQLEPILAYFGGDFYKSTSWEDFQAKYKSPNAQ
jgi:thioredoxin-related protein